MAQVTEESPTNHLGSAEQTMNKVRLGFLGAGWWATANHMPLLAKRDDVEFAAVCRLGRAELEQVKERFGFRFATESAEELVRQLTLQATKPATEEPKAKPPGDDPQLAHMENHFRSI